MDTINIEGTEDTPKIILDTNAGVYSISGRSLPEDVATFYKPVLDWLNEYASSPQPEMNFEIKLEYFNTASSKLLLDILMKLEEIAEGGAGINVQWNYDEQDEDMQEAGEEYSELVSIPFKMIPY